jgi:rare lipoprotein A
MKMKKVLNLKFVFFICGVILLMMTSFMLEDEKYIQTGKASYYSRKFQGRETSSGEIFKHNKFTAAHKTLPFGSVVRVVNLENDSIVYVKINDRLPKTSKRLIDLTRKAAIELNFIKKGLTKVVVERVL